jgi:antitoxin component YwqK of YwqJK toxin-antitoxin module
MKLNGVSKTFYESGHLYAEETFQNGNLEGVSKTYHENGNLWTEDYYKNGLRHGICRVFDKKGRLIEEKNYTNGEEGGKIITYSYRSNGTIEKKYIYENSSKTAYIEYLYDLKERLETEKCINNGKKNGFVITYYKSGGISSKAKYKNNRLHGLRTKYDEKGKAIVKEKYSNGVRQGITEYEYDTNILKRKCEYPQYYTEWDELLYPKVETYKDFLEHDESIYNRNGRIVSKKRHYEDGSEKMLIEYEYHPNGHIKERKDYTKLEIKRYSESGFIIERQEFIGTPNGKLSKYYSDGKIKSEIIYKHGIIQTEKQFDYSDHSILVMSYYPNGNIKLEEKFSFSEDDR